MAQILKIERLPRASGRVLIELDDGTRIGLEKETAGDLKLCADGEFDPDELTARDYEREASAAFNRALTMLDRRARTRAQIRSDLEGRLFLPEAVDAAIEKLEHYRFVDDEDYAKRYASDKQHLSGYGRRRIQMGLRQIGIEEETAQKVISELDPELNEQALEREAEKAVRRVAGQPYAAARAKAGQALARRGFSWEEIDRVLRRKLRQNEEE